MKQVALVRFARGRGFAYEPIVYVKRVRFFNSKKEADRYNRDIWTKIGCPKGSDPWSPTGSYDKLPFLRFQKGSKEFEQFACKRMEITPSSEEIDAYIR